MKAILHEMGGAVVAAACTALVVLLLFSGISREGSSGILSILGDGIAHMYTEPDGQSEAEAALRSICSRPRPTADGSRVQTDRSYLPKDIITAVDADGREAEIKILAVTSATAGDAATGDVYDGERLLFTTPGIYEIRMQLTDREGAGHVCYVYVEAEDAGS